MDATRLNMSAFRKKSNLSSLRFFGNAFLCEKSNSAMKLPRFQKTCLNAVIRLKRLHFEAESWNCRETFSANAIRSNRS